MGHKVKIQSQQTPFLFGDSSWGYDMSCGWKHRPFKGLCWKQGLGWGEDWNLVKGVCEADYEESRACTDMGLSSTIMSIIKQSFPTCFI